MELGPLELVICWQSMLLSVLVYAATRSCKSALVIIAGESKTQILWVKHVALPILPLALGAVIAMFFPFKPDLLMKWEHAGNNYALFATYGAVIGQFSDYLHQRINGILKIKEGVADS